MSLNSYVCKIPVVNSGCVGILSTEWTDMNVKFLLVHDNQGWIGEFTFSSNEDIMELIDQLSLTEEQYFSETKRALTSEGGAEHFIYTINNNSFIWKKYVSKNMAVKFGCAAISQVPVCDIFERIIDNTVRTNLKMNEDFLAIRERNTTLQKENFHLKTKLDEAIARKTEMEKTLYSQFLHLLNEKKKKIKELKNKLDPNVEEESDADVEPNDQDIFDTDTEIDSEEEVQPSRVNAVEITGSIDADVTLSIPKRTRQSGKTENAAGPSGLCGQSRNRKERSNVKPNNSKETRPNRKKVNTVSSKLFVEEKSESNSEEYAFTFPKRSKKINNGNNLVKAPTCRINYDSEDETCLDKTVNINSESDQTPSQISPLDKHSLNITKTKDDNTSQNVRDKNSNDLEVEDPATERHKNLRNSNKNNTRTTRTSDVSSCKGFSSSTLDILNQLI